MPDQPAGCRTTRHCVTHDFCHRCLPVMGASIRHLLKAIDAAGITNDNGRVYSQLVATLRDAARASSGWTITPAQEQP